MVLDSPDCRVDREQEKEPRDIQYGLGASAVMVQEKRGWRQARRDVFTLAFQKDLSSYRI